MPLFCVNQETAFRKVVQATMIRDRQHGPVVELNRIQVNSLNMAFLLYMFNDYLQTCLIWPWVALEVSLMSREFFKYIISMCILN